MHLDGVLFFPVTPFTATGDLAPDILAEHLERGLQHGPGAVFAACGTGEFHALSAAEHATVVRTAVEVTQRRVPVFAGAGGPLPSAVQAARAAAEAGADGLLLMPPYLVTGPQSGLLGYVEAVAAATALPIVVYQRDGVRFTPDSVAALAALPQVIGFKDGSGDLGLVQSLLLAGQAASASWSWFNGTPTAEFLQAAYRAIGVPLYSSAAFAFVPEVALAFYDALEQGDDERRIELLTAFYEPLVALRDTVPGYAVALVKAGCRLRGLDVGGVRPPLVDVAAEHLDRLAELIGVVDGLVR